jgi:hypothetical protein
MLGARGLWAGRDLYHATPAVTRGLSFSGLIRRTAPFGRLLQHTRGCGGLILTRILMGLCRMEVLQKYRRRWGIHLHGNIDLGAQDSINIWTRFARISSMLVLDICVYIRRHIVSSNVQFAALCPDKSLHEVSQLYSVADSALRQFVQMQHFVLQHVILSDQNVSKSFSNKSYTSCTSHSL